MMMPHYDDVDSSCSPSLEEAAKLVSGGLGVAAAGTAAGGGGGGGMGGGGGGGAGPQNMSSPSPSPLSSDAAGGGFGGAAAAAAAGSGVIGAGVGIGGGGVGVGGGGVGSKRQRDPQSSSLSLSSSSMSSGVGVVVGLPHPSRPPPPTSFGRSGSMDLIGLNNSRTLTSARRTGSMDMIGGGHAARRTGSMDLIGGGGGGGGGGFGKGVVVGGARTTTSSSLSIRGDEARSSSSAAATTAAMKTSSLGLGRGDELRGGPAPGEFIPTSFSSIGASGAATASPSSSSARETGAGTSGGGEGGAGGGSEKGGGSGGGGGGRYTEAVPLSLSSATLDGPAFGFGWNRDDERDPTSVFASALTSSSSTSLPASSARRFDDGVSSGIREIVSHALQACVRYARAVYPAHDFTIRDVVLSSSDAWKLLPSNGIRVEDVPCHLRRVGYNFLYERNCVLFLSPGGMPVTGLSEEAQREGGSMNEGGGGVGDGGVAISYDDWPERGNALGRIVLRYASAKPLTEAQIQNGGSSKLSSTMAMGYGSPPPAGTSSTSASGPVVLVLWQAIVEYRSLRPTGSVSAASAEELAMTSFGGTVDDELKLGALAALVDPRHKFVLGVRSARGKKYKFDLIDATLSNGALPRYRDESEKKKSVCVTVTNVVPGGALGIGMVGVGSSLLRDNIGGGGFLHRGTSLGGATASSSSSGGSNASVTRLDLTLEGPLRSAQAERHHESLGRHFRVLDPQSPLPSVDADPDVVVGSTSGHVLLLRPVHAGKLYVDGRYLTTWGKDVSVGSDRPALFGYDLLDVPVAEGRIADYEEMKRACGRLLQECFVDARQIRKDVAGRMLSRLKRGVSERSEDEEERDLGRDYRRRTGAGGGGGGGGGYYDDAGGFEGNDNAAAAAAFGGGNAASTSTSSSSCCPISFSSASSSSDPSVNFPCLESEIMSDPRYDPVGISAKALATRFAERHGPNAYPCPPCDVEYVRPRLGRHRVPVPVPRRVLDVLRRGGYFDLRRTETERLWFDPSASRRLDAPGTRILREAIRLLRESGCRDVTEDRIVTVGGEALPPNPLEGKFLCRYSTETGEYYVNDAAMTVALPSSSSSSMSYRDGGFGGGGGGVDGGGWRIKEEEDEDDDDDDDEDHGWRGGDENEDEDEDDDENRDGGGGLTREQKERAYALGLCLAREHEDGNVLVRYAMRHRRASSRRRGGGRK